MAKKTDAEKKYEAFLKQKMDAIESPQELIDFFRTEYGEKLRAMNSALDKISAILGGNDAG